MNQTEAALCQRKACQTGSYGPAMTESLRVSLGCLQGLRERKCAVEGEIRGLREQLPLDSLMVDAVYQPIP